ncbi:hypothetical protein P3X46_011302 [Hevea brasiliensis]|uniref:START domain-containing protein n=1 Tax=Hevea brasiliensis TaxID=3981 RepID=A0ABQ9MHX0_HEVBR|nr:hypothetical protein P3X46_011302 [Hevea brasiliensis]
MNKEVHPTTVIILKYIFIQIIDEITNSSLVGFLFTVMGFGIHNCNLWLEQISIPLNPKDKLIKDITKATCYIHDISSQEPLRINMSTIQATFDTVYALEWVSSAAKNDCVAAVGLKWMLNQASGISFPFYSRSLEYFKSSHHLVLYYEELMKNRKSCFRKLVSHQVRVHIKPVSEQINN